MGPTSAAPWPAFVINLKDAQPRREHMERQLRAMGIKAEFVPAVDGAGLCASDRAAYDAARARRAYGAEMIDAELGCYLSHYRLLQRIVEANIALALVMEDDIEISADLPQIVRGLADVPDWLVVRLESLRGGVLRPETVKAMGRPIADLGSATLYRLDTHTLGLGAYLIRKEGARRMLNYGRSIFMPIDHTMDRYWENGIVPYVVRPFPVRQMDVFESRIGQRDPRRRRSLPLSARIGHRLQRIRDSIAKRIWRLSGARGRA